MNIYAFITPIVLFFLVLEIVVCLRKKNGFYNFQDTITNLATGIGNQCVNIAVAFFVYKFYGFIYAHIPWKVSETWYNYILLLLISDFVFYWFHRTGHSINVFWAAHMPHHSSEEFNLSVGIRASFTQRIFQFAFFDWVLVLFGFSPEMIYATAAVHLLIAYWHHTKLITKMGWFEKLFVSPSHHRVHHGVNPQYIDKNFSEFLIVWDKIFGTYEPEVEEVCYGITHPPRTWDPIFVNFQFWKHLWDDMIAAPYFWDKIRLWFMPLGWRPRGIEVEEHGVLGYNLDQQTKFSSKQLKNSKPYLVLQVVMALGYMFVTTNLQFDLSALHRVVLSGGIFLMIISWSKILEGNKNWYFLEFFRLAYMMGAIIGVMHFNGLLSISSWLFLAISALFGVSFLLFAFYVKKDELEGVASVHPEPA